MINLFRILKHLNIVVTVLAINFPCKTDAQINADSLAQAVQSKYTPDTIKNTDGHIKQLNYYHNSKIIARIMYNDRGKIAGIQLHDSLGNLQYMYHWYGSGKLYMNYEVKNGQTIRGYSLYETGQLESILGLKGDSVEKIRFHKSGEILEVRYERNGVPLIATLYCENGRIASVSYWGKAYNYKLLYCDGSINVEGVKNSSNFFCGKYTHRYPSGKLCIVGQFSDSLYSDYTISGIPGGLGQKIGEWKYYNAKGKLEKIEVYEEGRLIQTKYYKRRKLVSVSA